MSDYDETTQEEGSDDFAALRSAKRKAEKSAKEFEERALAAEAELTEWKVRGMGFSETQVKHLAEAVSEGHAELDEDSLWRHAESEFDWERPKMNAFEKAMAEHAARQADLASVTYSAPPPDIDVEIAEAEAVGNWPLARMLKSGKLGGALQKG